MDLMYFIINGLTLFILLYIYLEKKLNQHKILTLVGQILACTSLLYNLRNYAYAVFTVYVFNYLISIFSINRKLLLKDIVFTFVCILLQQISLLILMSIHMPYSQYISCFILLIVGILFIRLLKKYELDINIKQWWHFIIIGYIHSLSLYCFVIVYLKELRTEFVFLIFGFTALSILYIYLFRTIIKENQIKIDYEKNNLRRIHKNELNKVYYDIHNKEHQL